MAKAKKSKSAKKKAKAKTGPDRLTVDVDVDVHRAIEMARDNFAESHNDILRRLLVEKTDMPEPQSVSQNARAKGGGALSGGWSKIDRFGRSIFLPDGTGLRAAYAGKAVEGEIVAGMWVVAGHAHNSPSAALNANVRTRDGNPVNLNGWRHWEVRPPGETNWVRLNRLEPE